MKKLSITLAAAIALLPSCKTEKSVDEASAEPKDELQPTSDIQKALTPDAVIERLLSGNEKYVKGMLDKVDITARRDLATTGQFPKAYILSCVDSRVPVEKVFDLSIGDIFVGRVAGNIETTEQLGSMEFAANVSGVKIVLVLGHEACGAVKGAADMPELGNLNNLGELLKEIQPAVTAVPGFDENRTSKNAPFIDAVIKQNVINTVANIRERSPGLSGLEQEGKIKIIGGIYSLASGKVTLIE